MEDLFLAFRNFFQLRRFAELIEHVLDPIAARFDEADGVGLLAFELAACAEEVGAAQDCAKRVVDLVAERPEEDSDCVEP